MNDEKIILLNMKKVFNTLYKKEKSQSLRNIFKQVYGNEYMESLDNDSFISMTELRNIAKYLNINPGESFIDVGCGRGGPGMWIAHEIGANYYGFDLSEKAIDLATSRINEFSLEGKAQFKVGDICAIDFPDNYFHGAICIDTLLFATDQLAALKEVARIIRRDASFVITCWEDEQSSIMRDFHHLLLKTGFIIDVFAEVPDWERRQREVYQKILDSKKILIKDMGIDVAFIPIMEAKKYLPLLKYVKYILAVVRKP